MEFCPPNITFSRVWVNEGINKCFFNTVPISIIALILIFASVIQFVRYGKSSRAYEVQRPSNAAYIIQILLMILMIVISICRFVLHITISGDRHVYGYQIFLLVTSLTVWIFSIAHIHLEKKLSINGVYRSKHSGFLMLFWILFFLIQNLAFVSVKSPDWWFILKSTSDKVELGIFVAEYIAALTIIILGFKAPGIPTRQDYGSLPHLSSTGNTATVQASTWISAWKKMKILVPFMWPKNRPGLQVIVIFCFLFLVIGRVANVFVPLYYKLIINALGGDGRPPTFCWDLILMYVALKVLQGGGTGGMGILNNLRTFLWISVQQYTTREVQLSLFSHLHSLSLRWHLGRKTGEVLRIMDRGTTSINSLLSYIVFSIVPTICDILIAVVYFSTAFNIWFGLIVFATMVAYLACTFVVTEWRTKYRRSMNLADNEQRAKSVDSLLNYETVKYYGAEEYERDRYNESIVTYQKEEWLSNASLCFLNTLQNVIINGGLLTGSLLCASMVSEKTMTVGDYVLFSTYILQLYTPLNWFGTYYRMIQQNFIDMENMFDLLDEKEEVTDKQNAIELLPEGKIEFRDVHFSYSPEKPILKGVSFVLEKGKTLAVVGPSGAGKSTIMRLLFRFFDIQAGTIFIDGRNIKDYSQKSLRSAIGVVPQDTVLFNETVLYNIQYGRVTAPEGEVVEAAESAEIHQSIMGFPEKYQSKVGERGLKLSGGEKQRIAIARTILKAPAFILLDEATSALDTRTERNIQSALMRICAGRTTVIVAHRLSTIVHADTIMVLKDGTVVEKGSHDELMEANGEYLGMWRQQLEANNNAESSSGSNSS